jgi:hypothetical protein
MPKIATIKNFAALDDNGSWYLEGMKVKTVGGKTVLSPFYYNRFILSEDTSGFTNLSNLVAMDSYYVTSNGDTAVIGLTSSSKIYSFSTFISAYNQGLVHTLSGSYLSSSYGDLKVTKKKSVLYSHQDYLGIGHFGTASAASTTTKIIDSAGRNWATLGIAVNDKVWVIDQKLERTITSITTTNSTNDTLNFTALTGTASGDEFQVFADRGALNSGNYWYFFRTTAYPHYVGQPQVGYWKRQIAKFSSGSTGRYLITNGNYLATLSNDELSWNDNYKQLPDNTQAMGVACNGDKILILGAENASSFNDGSGRLMLWDDYTTGFLSIINLPQVPLAVTPYKTGFLFTMGAAIYYTDGYTYSLVSKLPDTDSLTYSPSVSFNSLKAIEDKIYLAAGGGQESRLIGGTWIYEMKKGWTVVPFNEGSTTPKQTTPLYGTDVGALAVIPYSYPIIYSSFSLSSYSWTGSHFNCVNQLKDSRAYRAEAILFVPIGRQVNIKKVVLGFLPDTNNYFGVTDPNLKISVSIASNRKPMFKYAQTKTGSTSSSIINALGATYSSRGKVGNQIRIKNYSQSGQTSWITEITNEGTANETWTISPALSGTPEVSSQVSIRPFKLLEQKTIDTSEIPDNIEFDGGGIEGDGFYIQIILEGVTQLVGLDINYIDLYV